MALRGKVRVPLSSSLTVRWVLPPLPGLIPPNDTGQPLALEHQATLLPQGLCTCPLLCLEQSYPGGSSPSLPIYGCTQTSSSSRGLPNHPLKNSNAPKTSPVFAPSLNDLIPLHRTYHHLISSGLSVQCSSQAAMLFIQDSGAAVCSVRLNTGVCEHQLCLPPAPCSSPGSLVL